FFLSRKSQQSKQYLRVLSQKCTNFKNGNFENVARSSKTIFSFLSAVIMLKLVRNVIKLDVVNKFANNFVNFRKKAFSDKFLLVTNVGISLGLSSLGDVLEQHYEIYTEDLEKWDKQRTSHMAISGVTVGV
uniref:Uncharacterized protein n=1 Tax=Megaselia scalaris TaxID=36166 RepID=T1GFL1_MEGSC